MKHFPPTIYSGFITLIAVIILSVVSVAIVIGILMTGISTGKISQGNERGLVAKSFANNCAEYALVLIRDLGIGTVADDGFTKSISVDDNDLDMGLNQSSCSVEVIDNGGESRTIRSTGTVGAGQEATRRILVEVTTISPRIITTSWEEVDSF